MKRWAVPTLRESPAGRPYYASRSTGRLFRSRRRAEARFAVEQQRMSAVVEGAAVGRQVVERFHLIAQPGDCFRHPFVTELLGRQRDGQEFQRVAAGVKLRAQVRRFARSDE